MTHQTPTTLLPAESFLAGVYVARVGDDGIESLSDAALDAIVQSCVETSEPQLTTRSEDGASLHDGIAAVVAIPTFHAGRLASVTVLSAKAASDGARPVGVFEDWRPVGQYDEVSLAHGYFGSLDRFANVSSFVRFEKASGLPGQVWEQLRPVLHKELSNHPGFLRAAGASADMLETAVGLPVYNDSKYIASIVLISSATTPIARGFETWVKCEGGCILTEAVCSGLPESFALPVGAVMESGSGWLAAIEEAGGAVLSQGDGILWHGRSDEHGDKPALGLALPCFEDGRLDSFVALYF